MPDAPAPATTLTPPDKGLARGALSLTTSTVIGVASTAPAYSLAATLGLVVAGVGLQAPVVVVLAFLPILGVALGYRELNAVEPDCGTTFTWGTRAFGPWVGWFGGWAIVVADVLVMASLAQVAGQYTFLLVGADGIGSDATSPWVLAVGVAFMVAMTWLCLRGTELSARLQAVLLAVEFVALVLFAGVALVRVLTGSAGDAALTPSPAWFDPTQISSPGALVSATLLMVFIYWGWDSALSVNEETVDRRRVPGLAAVLSTVLLVAVYVLVTVAAQAFAGVGDTGTGLANPDNADDVISVLGTAVFGQGWFGRAAVSLLLLMVLTSAAACTQTTILPTARTTLAMAVYRALPDTFARVHPRWATPTTSTVAFGVVSVLSYLVMHHVSGGDLVTDAVSAVSVAVGVYYGLTGLACGWLFRHRLTTPRHLLVRGVAPVLGGAVLLGAVVVTTVASWGADSGETSWTLPFAPHWQVGGVFLLGVGSLLLGLPLAWAARRHQPEFFRGEVLTRGLPTGAADPDPSG